MSKFAKTLISAALLAGVAFSGPVQAMPIAKIYDAYRDDAASPAALITPDQPLMLSGARLDRLNEQTARSAASKSYYDFDAIITLGSLALAGGALAAVAFAASRKSREEADEERNAPARNWRESVLQNLEADLTAYARNWDRAA